jgi:hypothetical protein
MKYSMTRQDKGDVLREIQFIWNIPMTGQEKGDLLIQVTECV